MGSKALAEEESREAFRIVVDASKLLVAQLFVEAGSLERETIEPNAVAVILARENLRFGHQSGAELLPPEVFRDEQECNEEPLVIAIAPKSPDRCTRFVTHYDRQRLIVGWACFGGVVGDQRATNCISVSFSWSVDQRQFDGHVNDNLRSKSVSGQYSYLYARLLWNSGIWNSAGVATR